jgi:tripartite-type tricarboxylate transporter receptor subunit TctC
MNERKIMRRRTIALAVVLVATIGLSAEAAAEPNEFYKGKTVTLYVGTRVGGGYDTYGRMVARFIARHIPGNPAIVVENMDGAGTLRLANWLGKIAPKDGTVFGIVSHAVPFDPLLRLPGANFNATDFAWLGSANKDVSVCVSWKTAPVKTFAELTEKQLIIGAEAGSEDTGQFPRIMNDVLGTKFHIVAGYAGGNEINLAMQRGEVEGRCGFAWSALVATHADWLNNKDVNVLVQGALERHKELPDTPLVTDFAKTEAQRQILELIFARETITWPFLAPPGTPPERVAVLREAFMETMADPEFLAACDKARLAIDPLPGTRVEALIKEIYRTPPEIAEQAAAMLD